MSKRGRGSSLAVAGVVAVLLGIAGLVGWQVRTGQTLPDGPVQVAWEKEPCAHCHMHLSERHFAVQLQTRGGEVVNFDDPGCFLSYAEEEAPEVHEVWFHHSREDRWVARGQVAFVTAPSTPMNFGLAAVDARESGAMSYEEARSRVVSRQKGQG